MVDFFHKGPEMRKAFVCHDVTVVYCMTQWETPPMR